MKFPKSFLKTHFVFLILLLGYFVLSILIYKDFGPTGDEWTERRAAENLAIYMPRATTYDVIVDKHYNDSIDYEEGHHPLVTRYQRSYQLMQYLLNSKGYYEWDHLINLFFGALFFILAYFATYKFYKSSWKALIPVIFIAMSPRLVGDIPANNKDMPFAVMYLASLVAIYWFSVKKTNTYIKIIILGVLFGLMETFRIVGFSIYFVYLIYHIYCFWTEKNIHPKKIVNFTLELLIIGIFSLFVSVSIFPWLGANFYMNFYTLLLDAKSFQNWDDTIFFAGKFLMKNERPWYYLFTWIFITTPVSILILLSLSPIYIKKLWKNKLFMLMITGILVNLSLYLILQPVIYNGIRHFLFLLPLFAIASAIVCISIWDHLNKALYKVILVAFLSINALTITYNLITLHPYQYIYFNELIGGLKGAYDQYELDYWGASYKEATEWLVDNKELSHKDIIYACNVDYAVDYYSEKEFFMTYGYPPIANYTICDVENEIKHGFDGEILHEVKRQGVPLNRIRKHTRTE